MSHLFSAFTNLVAGIYEVFAAFFTTLFSLISTFVHAIFALFSGVFHLIGDLITGLINVAGGIVGFILGNLVMIGVVGGLVYGYLAYQRKQGNAVRVGNKKLN